MIDILVTIFAAIIIPLIIVGIGVWVIHPKVKENKNKVQRIIYDVSSNVVAGIIGVYVGLSASGTSFELIYMATGFLFYLCISVVGLWAICPDDRFESKSKNRIRKTKRD